MSDQATERVFQNDIIKQMLANGWHLGQPEKYNRELAFYYGKQPDYVIGFVQQTQDAQCPKCKAPNHTTTHKR
jgi:type I restriction enzyme R subunit